MASASIGSVPSNSQIGPASAQPLTLQQQYSQANLKRDISDERAAWMATDSTRVQSDASNIRAEMPAAGLPSAQASRILQDASNPGPTALAADSLYLDALTTPDSALTTSATYKPDNLPYLTDTNGDAGQPPASSFGSSPAMQSSPSLSNLPSFGTAAAT